MAAMRTASKVAIARAASRALSLLRAVSGRSMRARTVRNGLHWDLDLREGIDLYIYLAGRFEWRLSRTLVGLVRPGDVIVDAGANIGAHTLPLARAAGPRGRVFAYEPTAFAYEKLRANISLNPDLEARIIPVQAMLVGAPSDAMPPAVYASWPLTTTGELHELHCGRAMTTRGAQVSTLDDHLGGFGVGRFDLLKIDVDGSECAVLNGAASMLERYRPVVVMEWAPYLHDSAGHRLAECLQVVRRLGYKFRDAASGRPLPTDLSSASADIAPGASINVVGHAPGRE
jgi:FkbM family methyltransferase